MTTTLDIDRAEDRDFWRELQPDLHIEGDPTPPRFEMDPEALVRALKLEGYLNVPGIVPAHFTTRLHACIKRLHELNIPLIFAYAYDEMWQVFQGVSPYLEAALGKGYRALPDFWAWYVLNTDGEAGWGPHRDRVEPPSVGPDNEPYSLTVWLPFTEATPLNGCIYLVPAHLDPRYASRDFSGDLVIDDPQSIRALPASPGSLLSWNQNVLHWGGRASHLGAAPRCSAAFEFQRADKPPFNEPLLEPRILPTMAQRLGLIGKQVLQYEHMYPLTKSMEAIAVQLRSSHLPSVGG